MIVNAAREMGLDPGDAANASLSNLREIIRPAKWAIEAHDGVRLRELFHLGATEKNVSLRILLRGTNRPEIAFTRVKGELKRPIRLSLTLSEFERIRRAVRAIYTFREDHDQLDKKHLR
jgi:hypothetical protein